MKTILIIAVLASSAFAADQATVAAAESACGPSNIQFDVKTEEGQHPRALAQDGKALIDVVEVFEKPENQLSKPTTKVGLDGDWVGANKSPIFSSPSIRATIIYAWLGNRPSNDIPSKWR